MHELMADEIVAYTDGGGEFFAARRPVVGRDAVTRLFATVTGKFGMPTEIRPCHTNGLPAVLLGYAKPLRPGFATSALLSIELDDHGRVAVVRNTMATSKLSHMVSASGEF